MNKAEQKLKPIKRWKEFYALLPKKFQTNFNEKCYRKIFSLARRNSCDIESNKVIYRIHKTEGDFIFSYTSTHLTENSRFTKIPFKISLSSVKCISTGYEFSMSENIEVVIDSDGKYNLIKGRFNRSSLFGLKNIVKVGTKDEIERDYYNNKECREKIDYKHAGSYSIYLVTKDYLWYKKGQIIDEFYQHKRSNYHDRSPLDLFDGGHYHSVYKVGGIESIACDLNKVTLSQLEAINTKPFSCYKQKFGCQRGCQTYCYADSSNQADVKRKAYYISIYKRLNLGEVL